MKTISRDAIQRMTGSGSGGVSVGGGGGASIDLTGYATEMWTEENYVGKEFFSSLFKAYDSNGNEVLPNDTDTQIDNIKAMFGFWTDFYISALGTGGQSTVGLRLAQLADVNVAGVQNDQVLKYDATSQKWVPGTVSGGSVAWSNITNKPTTISGYGITDCYISNGTITIGSSSITPITSHQSLAGYAKEQWVGQYYLPLTGGTITGSLTVNNTLSIGRNTTVGGDLTVNGGDLTVNEPNPSGASAIWFQSGGTTYGNLRVKADNGEFYFYQGTANSGQSSVCVNVGNLYSYGYVSALSDERKKNVVSEIELTVEQIAKAPAIKFTWKDKKKPGLFAGSLAQYWQKALPEVVQDHDDTLTLDYQVTALMAAIVTARKVVNHESRLRRLEKMFEFNEYDLED